MKGLGAAATSANEKTARLDFLASSRPPPKAAQHPLRQAQGPPGCATLPMSVPALNAANAEDDSWKRVTLPASARGCPDSAHRMPRASSSR
eukprot:958959-Rhodomonas_salina.5